MKASRLVSVFLSLVVTGGAVFAFSERQQLYDWVRLQNYQPPTQISQLAADDTMTAAAQHLFYINHPNLTADKAFFNKQCGNKEQTIVLGCYHGNQQGIYLYEVSDARLNGVEQVTAAHEMLHAAYDRLSTQDRKNIDAMLQDYYAHGLHDKRIQDSIDLYKKIEPNDVVNEMHSVFGTEVADLPAPLENYYKRYFGDRHKIVQYATDYQGTFTSLQNQVATDDAQLAKWKPQIDTLTSEIQQKQRALATQKAQLDAQRASGNIDAYNAGVTPYNAAVNTYNALVESLKNLIAQYNALVDERNAIAIQENQLAQAINSQASPVPAQ
ncbi:MAG TPA: hypothetical protein VJR27_02110 [Candidatus Saccharimonadales bacterium]|nr:hypothetical protein [Candidatus Saccharimonadales bacterium]